MFKPKQQQEDVFFSLFIEDAKLTNDAAKLLNKCFEDISNSEPIIKQIKEMEHKGDQLVHEIIKQLTIIFITPLEREDIHAIAKKMDNILDYIEGSASRIMMFNVTSAPEKAKELCKMIIDITEALIRVMELLSSMNKSGDLLKAVIEVTRIEEEGDKVSRSAIRELFTNEFPEIEIVKWREIYQYLENTLDSCEDVANLIRGIEMKSV